MTAVAISSVYFDNDSLNGGINGGQVTGPTLFGLNLEIGSGGYYPRIQFGLLCLVVLTLVALGVANLRRSRLGAQMLAVRANERSAAANGINVARVKLAGFGIAAVIAGLGGALLGYQQTSVSGDSFDALSGILLFGICYISGITTITGAVAAGLIGSNGLIYVIINRQINFGSYYLLITGLILIFAIIRHPEGLGGTIQEPLERLARRVIRRKPPAATPALGAAAAGTAAPSAPERVVLRWQQTRRPRPQLTRADGVAPAAERADLTVRYGGVVALDSVSLQRPGGRVRRADRAQRRREDHVRRRADRLRQVLGRGPVRRRPPGLGTRARAGAARARADVPVGRRVRRPDRRGEHTRRRAEQVRVAVRRRAPSCPAGRLRPARAPGRSSGRSA